jgi:STE24 endopeptidase
MEAHGFRLPLAVVGAAAAAGAATLLLRPRSGLIDPAPVRAEGYFSEEELQRARDFRRPQRAIAFAGMAASGATIAALALRPPAALSRARSRPLAGAAAAGAAGSLLFTAVGLPFSALSHRRAVRFGLSTQTWRSWFSDLGKASALGTGFSGAGAALGMGLVRRYPRYWWLPGSAAIVGVGGAFTFLSPLLLDPIFNKFTPLPAGPLRTEVLDLAGKAGVDVGEVYRVDASRRTTGVNAYVWGLGRSKRVVLYDTLIDGFPSDQVRSVVAHELSHVKHRDVPRGLLWLAIFAPAGTLLVKEVADSLSDGAEPGPAMLPALALATSLVSFWGQVAGNVLSRAVERRADAFALSLTDEPEPFIEMERALSVKNLGDPSPPRLMQLLFGTHPDTLERIGFGVAWGSREQQQ